MQILHRNPHVILAIPGFTHSPAAMAPLAEALIARNPHCSVILFELPEFPEKKFGNISLLDYATAVAEKVQQLKTEQHVIVHELMGHSMGGLVSLLAHQILLTGNQHVLRQVTILASSSIRDVPWSAADSGIADKIGDEFTHHDDPILGTYASVPDNRWVELWFSLPDRTLASNTPPPEIVRTLNVRASGRMDDELSRKRPGEIPHIPKGIFQGPTRLQQLVFADDPFALIHEQKAMFDYLTGNVPGKNAFRVVCPEESIHDLILTQPGLVAEHLDGYAGPVVRHHM